MRPDCLERFTTALTNAGVVCMLPILAQEINSLLTEDGGNLLDRPPRPSVYALNHCKYEITMRMKSDPGRPEIN